MKDYFSIHRRATAKAAPRFLCNVQAESVKDALRVARSHGFRLNRYTVAFRIGKEGYYRALASTQ